MFWLCTRVRPSRNREGLGGDSMDQILTSFGGLGIGMYVD